MKKKLVFISGLLFLGLISLGAEKVWAVTVLPRVTTACETRIGGLLMGIGDGFSTLKSCPGNSRKVILGEVTMGNGGGGGIRGLKDIAFVDRDYALRNNGEIWGYSPDDENIFEWNRIGKLPDGVTPAMVLQWNYNSFLTVDGIMYIRDNEVWVSAIEIPTSVPTP